MPNRPLATTPSGLRAAAPPRPLAPLSSRRLLRLALSLALLASLAALQPAAAAPTPAKSSATQRPVLLETGRYRVMASVFGTPSDDLVGEETSSGHILARFDRIVSLPACTESSCPWLDLDAGVGHEFGPQTACAGSDGLCWVKLVSADTGRCAVAPVLDRGPLFVRDNWWAAKSSRTYQLSQGLPAAEAVRDGADLGFGPGISDRGHDVANVFDYAAAIDIASGSWSDLGLDVDAGIGMVDVELLWQTETDPADACDGPGYGNAATTDDLNLRAGPSLESEVIAVMPAGSRVGVTGGRDGKFYPVVYRGLAGWASGDYLDPDGAAGGALAVVAESLNLRAGPAADAEIIRTMPSGALVVLDGAEENGYLAVAHNGTDGWAAARYLDAGDHQASGDDDDDDDGGGQAFAFTTDALNLRAGPGLDEEILTVMPAGARVSLTGASDNDFLGVVYRGRSGWAAAAYLARSATVAEDLNFRAGPSTADEIYRVLPAGTSVALAGERENGFVAVTVGGQEGWLYEAYLVLAT